MGSAPLSFWVVNSSRYFLCLHTSLLYFIWLLCPFPPCMFLFRCLSHPLPLPLSSCLGYIPPLIGLPFLRNLLRSVLCGLPLVFSTVFVFVCVFCFLVYRDDVLDGYLPARSLLSAFPAYLRTYSRFDLVWFHLSCDHGWIRSESVNVR